MGKAKYKIITVFLIFIWSVFTVRLFAREGLDMIRREESQETAPVKVNSKKSELKESELIVSPHIEYKAEGLRDPLESYLKKEEVLPAQPQQEIAPSPPPPALTVQGIIWGGRFPQAIINNKIVKAGDTIEGVRIIDINKDGVTVFFGNRKYNLLSPAAANFNLQILKKEPKGGKHE